MCLFVSLSICLVRVCVCVCVSYRFDKEVANIVQEMKKGGVLEVRKKPIPPLTSLPSIDSRHWLGLNTSYLHSHYPGPSLVVYLLSIITHWF